MQEMCIQTAVKSNLDTSLLPLLTLAKLPLLPLRSPVSWFFASLTQMFLILPDTDSSLESGISRVRCFSECATKLQITAQFLLLKVISLLTVGRNLFLFWSLHKWLFFSKFHLCKYYEVRIYKLGSHFRLRLYTGYSTCLWYNVHCILFMSCLARIFRARIHKNQNE